MMRSRCSFSEENFLAAKEAKLSESLRRNPRFPKKMRSVKSKHSNPTVRTVGQLNCGGKSIFSTMNFTLDDTSSEPTRRDSEQDYERAWSKVHRSFSNSQSPRGYGGDCAVNQAGFCSVTTVKDEPQSESMVSGRDKVTRSHSPVISWNSHSDSGVQVNMFHCQECRRHIKYGKSYKLENSCTESDSENNQLSSIPCVNCESEGANSHYTDLLTSDDLCTLPDNAPPADAPSTPRLGILSKNGKQLQWLANIKLVTVTILVIPLILCLMQTQILETPIAKIKYSLIYLVKEEETEELSIVGWMFDFLFGVQGLPKPLPLFATLF